MARAIDPKAKAKRQKIIAAVGGVILLVLLAWRVPPVIALMNKKPPTRGSTPVAAPTPVAPTPGAPLPPSVPPTSGAPAAGDLVDSDVTPVAGPGQLVSFGRFVSKDPFLPQAGRRCVDSAGVTIPCSPSRGAGSQPKRPIKEPGPEFDQPGNSNPTSSPAARSSAQISVNGASQGVAVNATFPSGDPVFRLVSVTAKSVKVAIDGGSYASGETSITLKKGEPVTLVNTADGTRYRVVLVSTG